MNRTSIPLLPPDELRKWTRVSRTKNLRYLALDYFWLALVQLTNLYLISSVGIGWLVTSFGIFTILITGCLIHRIGLLGHEASHGLLHPSRACNDLWSDLLCFCPFWSSMDSYRKKHLGHHLHPNDPDRDPNMAGYKTEELYSRFPMPRPVFIWNYYARFFWPPFVLRNLTDLLKALSFGRISTGAADHTGTCRKLPWSHIARSPTNLGIIYLAAYAAITRILIARGDHFDLVTGQVFVLLVGLTAWKRIPTERFMADRRESYASPKTRALIRLLFYMAVISSLGWARHLTGFRWGGYYMIFWIFPLVYVVPYLMLLREIYQHANLGQGQLDNSRVIHADPITRWALLGYGNDFHLIHHLYPNIPHYHIESVHRALTEKSRDYRESVKETSGVFHSPEGGVSLLDSLAAETSSQGGQPLPLSRSQT